jgi:transcriptional regulator with XRE-family HTH domain
MGSVLDHLAWTCQRARKHAGVHQLRIASTAGVEEATISRWETRSRRSPDELEAIIAAYATECGVSARWLWDQALDAWERERTG